MSFLCICDKKIQLYNRCDGNVYKMKLMKYFSKKHFDQVKKKRKKRKVLANRTVDFIEQ